MKPQKAMTDEEIYSGYRTDLNDISKKEILVMMSQARQQGRAETTENPNFKKLKFFKKSVDVEEISLDRIGWTENRRDGGRGYVRAYLSRNYGIKLTPQAISDEVDMAIIYMLYDTATIVNDNIIEREKQAYAKGQSDLKARFMSKEVIEIVELKQLKEKGFGRLPLAQDYIRWALAEATKEGGEK